MAKRGLSDVVTTVLIILLVLAAVVIVWSFVQPAIKKGVETVPGQTACIQLDIQPVSCIKSATNPNLATVTYRWNSGDATLGGLKVILTKTDGTTIVDSTTATTAPNTLPARLESRTLSNLNFGGPASKVSIAAVVRTDTGQDVTCTESTAVTCT
ncbi:hypothetical protein KW787_03105 [Candidatus Pacearchaeota archaeon]|nr:hypothetical protein [Candidatus Pacearchaeota archaeon]